MQLTGGQYKGRKIEISGKTRPTLAIVRESVFNSLWSAFGEFEGLKFLDMFLGSGIISLEAVSRGFDVQSYEIDPQAIKTAQKNAQGFKNLPKITRADCFRALDKNNEKYEVIYADPPWSFSYLKVFEQIEKHLQKNGIAIVECEKRKKPEVLEELSQFSTLELFKEKNYGRCYLLFIKFNYDSDETESLST